ncbi:MAG: hypothetical protein EOS78_12495 [Mesorhizobium sp.]|nr:hypothetical protein EJ077_24780 [Mesorhizobium sp. M8A.F.Ca.ET.057.01.1.1]RWE38874.1 MAG: hypothetical protein EOS78_12495 [Mesorhizobium sp.]RWE41600.1 MAG: hypothetical protein EOS80_28140 [Mesorhizobium sp.]
MVRAAGARFFFPPKYSPDLNPIEQLFFKAQALAEKSSTPNRRSLLRRDRPNPQSRHTGRVLTLLRKLRLRPKLI